MLDIQKRLKGDKEDSIEKIRKEQENNLREQVELAIHILQFHAIEKMIPAEKQSRENYFQDKKGKSLYGVLIGQIPNFQKGLYCEVGDSCQFHGLIKEAFLLSNGRWKIIEKKIIIFSDGKQNQTLFLREESQDQGLDDFDSENLYELVNIKIDEQLALNARR